MSQVLVQSIPVALLGYMEAYAVGRKYAEVRAAVILHAWFS
jgi:hypothetical protein